MRTQTVFWIVLNSLTATSLNQYALETTRYCKIHHTFKCLKGILGKKGLFSCILDYVLCIWFKACTANWLVLWPNSTKRQLSGGFESVFQKSCPSIWRYPWGRPSTASSPSSLRCKWGSHYRQWMVFLGYLCDVPYKMHHWMLLRDLRCQNIMAWWYNDDLS